jgi:hypothetical protein
VKNVFLILASMACLSGILTSTVTGWITESITTRAPVPLEWFEMLHVFARAFLVLALCAQLAWLAWIHGTWKRIHLVIRPDDAPTPTKAVLMMITPVVNILWQFQIVAGACSLVNDALAKKNGKRRAPTGTAILWCLFASWGWALLPFLQAPWLTVVVPLLGFFLMRGMDAALGELAQNEIDLPSRKNPPVSSA